MRLLHLQKRDTTQVGWSLDHPSSTIFALDHMLLYIIRPIFLIFKDCFFALSLYRSLPLLLNV